MRWKIKQEKYVKGDERVIKKFLLLPLRVRDEIRWLENISVRQQYYGGDSWLDVGYVYE